MSKYNYSDLERQFNAVLKYHDRELSGIQMPDMTGIDACIAESEKTLGMLGYGEELARLKEGSLAVDEKKIAIVPSWERLCMEAERAVGTGIELESIFTEEELQANDRALSALRREYNQIHHLDKYDIGISVAAGILGAAVDILLVGIPKKGPDGITAGKLSDFIRKKFDEKFPPDEMQRLANSKASKVPYDAQDNRNTEKYVDGLSAYYHRLLSLGHDPLLGFIFGVLDILTGRMTTIDKTGKIVSQAVKGYADRRESNIFAAIAKQIVHLKSDITTSMGLPVPMMSLFNFLQFGSIGEEEQTIAEIVQGMYYEGYDFIHFCSMSIPAMIVEVAVRLGYAFKRLKEGHTIKESIPLSLNRTTHPKLATMLFVGHSASTAINAGKVYFIGNPLAINYPQWLAFAKYSYKQLKWAIMDKPRLRDAYVQGKISERLCEVYEDIDDDLKEYVVVFEE